MSGSGTIVLFFFCILFWFWRTDTEFTETLKKLTRHGHNWQITKQNASRAHAGAG